MDLLTPDFGVFFWQSIILLVVLFVLGKFAWKPVLGMIKNRESFIEDSLIKANECNRRVSKIEEECFEIVKGANSEKSKIIQGALEDRKKIINKARDDAKNIGNKIVSDVEQSMTEYRKETIQNSKQDILAISIMIAETVIKREVETANKNIEFLEILITEELTKKINTVS
ncbi:MAG: F0F1 ATP synthase subunit B [Cytophagales bacterium]|jgi:F-type H+-transporting ATPase subunit b|nr:F0F1 ATP synthase subunit B [Cytophagales bacterium]